MQAFFTAPDAWSGGYFELSLEFPALDAEAHSRAVNALWRHAALRGCYRSRDIEPDDQAIVAPSIAEAAL